MNNSPGNPRSIPFPCPRSPPKGRTRLRGTYLRTRRRWGPHMLGGRRSSWFLGKALGDAPTSFFPFLSLSLSFSFFVGLSVSPLCLYITLFFVNLWWSWHLFFTLSLSLSMFSYLCSFSFPQQNGDCSFKSAQSISTFIRVRYRIWVGNGRKNWINARSWW